jgi:hypothetical protein
VLRKELMTGHTDTETSTTTSIITTTLQAAVEVVQLRAQVAQLQQDNAVLLKLVGGTTPEPTTVIPKVDVPLVPVDVPADKLDYGMLAVVIGVMILLWILPLVKPFKLCCNRYIYRVFPAITLFNLLFFAVALSYLQNVAFNQIFFSLVHAFELALNVIRKVLVAIALFMAMILLWKFKDRIFEAMGIDNPTMVIGEFRDWATCWSMKRFNPIEVFIWKVEGLPSVHLHQGNDVFVEVCSGYNNSMRSRVHYRAGSSCVLKESVQLNHDELDTSTRLYITVKNQDVVGTSDIASTTFGTIQVNRLMEPDLAKDKKTIGWGSTIGGEDNRAWDGDQFKVFDLVPAGRIWLRIQSVSDDSSQNKADSC